MSITIRISVIAALLIAVSNAVPQRNVETNHQPLDDDVETNHQLLDDDALSIVCSKLDKDTLLAAMLTSRSMYEMIKSGVLQRAVIRDARSSGEQICIALAGLWDNYDVEPVPLNQQLTRRVLTERYKSAQIVSKEERRFLMLLLPDHGNEMVAIVLLRRLFRSFVESSDPMLAVRNFNDLDDKKACRKAIKHQFSLLLKFKFEEQPHNLYFDNEFFKAFRSYLKLSSGGLLRDSFHGISRRIIDELTRDRSVGFNFCNPGYGSLEYAKLVLQLGADPFGDGSYTPPLHAACWLGSIDVVKVLFLFTGSQQLLTRVMSSDNANALHWLGRCEGSEVSAEIGRLILQSSRDAEGMIRAIDSDGNNPLYIATLFENSNLLSLYLHNLSNLDRDLFASLMDTAIGCYRIDIVGLLLPFGGIWLVDLDVRQRILAHARAHQCWPEIQHEVIRLINDFLESVVRHYHSAA